MLRVTVFLFLFTAFTARAQQYFIDWTLPTGKNINPNKLLPDSAMNFYTEHVTPGQMFQSGQVSHFVNGEIVSTEKIPTAINNNIMTLERMEFFSGHLVGFYSDRQTGYHKLFIQEFDPEMDPIGGPRLVSEFSTGKGAGNRGYFYFQVSPSRKFLCAEYVIPGKKSKHDRIGFSVLDSALTVTTSGEYEVPFDTRLCTVDNRFVSDKGEYLLTISEYNHTRTGIFRDYFNIIRTLLVYHKGRNFKEYDLQVPENKVFDVGVTTDGDEIIVTGTYGGQNQDASSGVFVQKINSREQRLVSTSFREFPENVLTPDHTSFGYPVVDPTAQQPDPVLLKNYTIRDIYRTNDNSVVVLAEQYFIYQQVVSDMRGLYNTINYYYYDDILAYKLDSLGNFSWIMEIPKEQYSINDNAYFSSFRSVMSNGKIICIFNDSRYNYDEAGVYNGDNLGVGFPVRRTYYALGLVSIDIQSSELNRVMLNDYNQAAGVVAMSLTAKNPEKRELLLYSSGSGEQFGLFRY